MVAKGLDFENVTLVGVLSADISLYVDNYRAAERTFSLLTQVVGRAGRGGRPGRAVIQTYTPENDVIQVRGPAGLRELLSRGDPDAAAAAVSALCRPLSPSPSPVPRRGRYCRAAVAVAGGLRRLCALPELAAENRRCWVPPLRR